jgi:hypothetical protein
MGSVETGLTQVVIYSHIITYGNAADPIVTEMIRSEIETMWNEPNAFIQLDKRSLSVAFSITASHQPSITDLDIYQNLDPRNNYFRIEEFAQDNISFVDAIGCNTGYFKLENLYKGSTTAAHEYGHTIGLEHPDDLDLRGKGVPGIMYPRGTWVDPQYQYDPAKAPGTNGGTLHPIHRRVQQADIEALQLERLDWQDGKAILGGFTSIWHPDHSILRTRDDL